MLLGRCPSGCLGYDLGCTVAEGASLGNAVIWRNRARHHRRSLKSSFHPLKGPRSGSVSRLAQLSLTLASDADPCMLHVFTACISSPVPHSGNHQALKAELSTTVHRKKTSKIND